MLIISLAISASRVFGEDQNMIINIMLSGLNPAEVILTKNGTSTYSNSMRGDRVMMKPYRYYLSRDANSRSAHRRANAFTYKYTFRMWNDIKSVSYLSLCYTGIVSIKQRNFDWDDDGVILVVSRYKQVSRCLFQTKTTGLIDVPIEPAEIGKSLDFQFHKKQSWLVRNNNVVISLENQRGDALQFFSSPIGGVPVYQPVIGIRKVQNKK